MIDCNISNNKIKINSEVIFKTPISLKQDDFLFKAYKEFSIGYPKFHKMDSICKLGVLTASLLFKMNNVTHDSLKTGIIISSSFGCYQTDTKYINAISRDPESSNPALFIYTLPSIVMGEICIKEKIQGENVYLITDTFNSELVYKIATDMVIKKGMNHCLVGWVNQESSESYKSHLTLLSCKDLV